MAINYIRKFLSGQDLDEIKNEIGKIEESTSGEIRLCFKLKRGFHERKLSSRDSAMKEFYKLGMDRTEDKTGVLIYILFGERKFEIVADEGINSKIRQETWDVIISHLTSEFSQGNFKTGLMKCLGEIKNVLIAEFPAKFKNENELSNDIVIK
ncbi:MAG: TPM domain-containing protein [Ignavibacteriae bacterium]|nr:TPM domain-containing protein [Ignavibacteriota bacterium]